MFDTSYRGRCQACSREGWWRILIVQSILVVGGLVIAALGAAQLASGSTDRRDWGILIGGCILAAVAASLVGMAIYMLRRLRRQPPTVEGGGGGR
jgi:xanthine/uracil permease